MYYTRETGQRAGEVRLLWGGAALGTGAGRNQRNERLTSVVSTVKAAGQSGVGLFYGELWSEKVMLLSYFSK